MEEPRRVGKYELVSFISKGGMGELYRARHAGPAGYDREVALKIIREDLTPESRQHFTRMFTEEAKILSKLNHANLIHIYELGEEGKTLFISMELVEGHDLAQIITQCRELRTGPLALRYLLHIVEQVSRGLDYAHRLKVDGAPFELVHRDVSPSNILISFDGAVKLTDFGVARIQRAEPLTQSGVLKGKTAYMAPEYLSGAVPDRRADVFSLGVVLWEGLTGRRLFPSSDDAERRRHLLTGTISPPSQIDPVVPPALDGIVLKALERNPNARFQTARELGSAVRDFAQAKQLLADDVDLAKELRRLFPQDVPATAMDLRGLTRMTLVGDTQRDVTERPASQAPRSGPTPVVIDSADLIVEPPATESTSPKVTQRLPLAQTDPDPELQQPRRAEVTTEPERPRLTDPEQPQHALPATDPQRPQVAPVPVTDPDRPAVRPTRWGRVAATAAAAVLLAGGVTWWRQSTPSPLRESGGVSGQPIAAPENPTPTPTPTATATATPTPTPTPVPSEPPPSPLPGERAGVRGPQANPPPTPKRAHPTPPHRALNPGTLSVIAIHPWVQVFVDGVARGYSPAPSISVPAGRHKIVLSNDEMHLSKTFSVVIPESGRVVFRGEFETLKPAVVDQ